MKIANIYNLLSAIGSAFLNRAHCYTFRLRRLAIHSLSSAQPIPSRTFFARDLCKSFFRGSVCETEILTSHLMPCRCKTKIVTQQHVPESDSNFLNLWSANSSYPASRVMSMVANGFGQFLARCGEA